MSAAGPSNYETIRIEKSGVTDGAAAKTVQIEGKTIDFNYYESIYSPMITAQATIIDNGDSVLDNKDRLGTIKDTLSPASKKLLRKNPSYSQKIFNSRLSIFL